MRLIDADKLNLWTALRPYCSSDVCCEVTDIINNAPTVNPYEWISVKDRLPEDRGWYWVALDVNIVNLCFYSENDGFVLTLEKGLTLIGDRVSYWMPQLIPSPPTGKEN